MDMDKKLIKRLSVICLTFVFLFGTSCVTVNAKPFVWHDKPKDYGTSNTSSSFSILGNAVATKEQCIKYLLRYNPRPSLTVSPKELVEYYYTEGQREGIRPDVAFAQALQETGYFRYGGTVLPGQNNYCGLGTTGGGVKGAWFKSAQIGVRAHIQHIMAYATTQKPKESIVDPRYDVVKTTRNFGKAKTWTDLNGRWAIPGNGYGQKILKIHSDIIATK